MENTSAKRKKSAGQGSGEPAAKRPRRHDIPKPDAMLVESEPHDDSRWSDSEEEDTHHKNSRRLN